MLAVIFSEKFIENVLSLVLTAILTGILVPLLFRWIDHRRNREQKIFEATLSRQNKIIDSQVKLLEDLSCLLWEYQLLFINVPYFKQFSKRDLYIAAVKEYIENSGEILGNIRAEISKSIRLVSPTSHQQLKDMYYKDLLPIDLELNQLIDQDTKDKKHAKDWENLQIYVRDDVAKKVDEIIDYLANELQLKLSKEEKV
ncbi:hypothetical protein [uncultured Dokdonia sp.]|uniref:hypothetical protein n=1 Tax=uncultured Dokdonia sp. TaxID=575653 RepID=UPI0026206DCC|nr:hypothetical protein [uncultured Dokdonia sp.]